MLFAASAPTYEKKSQENLIPKLNRFSATPPPSIPDDVVEQQLHQQEAHFFDTGVLLNISFWNLHFGNLHIFRLLPGRSSRAGKRLFNKSVLHTPFNVIVMRFETKWLGRLYCSIQQPSQTIPSDEFEPTGTDDELEWRLIFFALHGNTRRRQISDRFENLRSWRVDSTLQKWFWRSVRELSWMADQNLEKKMLDKIS